MVAVGGDEPEADANGKMYFGEAAALEFARTFVDPDVDDARGAALEYLVAAEGRYASTDSVVKEARADDADGATIRDVVDDGGGNSRYTGEPSDMFVAFDPNQVKSADFNGGTYSVREDDIRLSTERGAARENKHGFVSELLDLAKGKIALPEKRLFMQATNASNVDAQRSAISLVLGKFKTPENSVNDWNWMMAFALADKDVPIPQYQLIKRIGDGSYGSLLKSLSPG